MPYGCGRPDSDYCHLSVPSASCLAQRIESSLRHALQVSTKGDQRSYGHHVFRSPIGTARTRLFGEFVRRLSGWSERVGVIGPSDEPARRFGEFGVGSALLYPQGVIYNEAYLRIGQGCLIGPNVCLTAGMGPGQPMLTNPVVSIGDRCVIGRGSHIIGHWRIELGDDIQTGPYVYITDQNHGYEDLVTPVGLQPTKEAAVRIGSGSWLGTQSVILPGAELGRNCVVAAGAVVRGRFPDHCVVAGVPAKIVRLYEEGEWRRPAT